MFPFPVQVCSIEMILDDLDLKTVRLVPGILRMEESLEVLLFTIKDWQLEYSNISHPKKGVRMTIKMKRNIMNEMMTTYLPSTLLILITYATTFFKPYFFEAALTVNLTTMLVMTTIFMTVMQMLPATAYVKMIDIFLIFGQLYPFCEVVLLTIMEYNREGDGIGGIMSATGYEKEPATDSVDKGDNDSEDSKAGDSKEKIAEAPVKDKLHWLKLAGTHAETLKYVV